MAEGRRPNGQPTCGVWPKASLLCGTQVTRVRIDGGAVQSFISQGPTVINISFCKKKKYIYIFPFLVTNEIGYVILANTMAIM